MKENQRLEFKETITNTFLKTVSAFANYGGGEIIFGIRDDGSYAPIEDPEQKKLDIENKVNDSIVPQPDYKLTVTDNGRTITLRVFSGLRKPYMYKSKAYKRNDTATIEVDQLELTRLIMEGNNISYESLPAKSQSLTFNILEGYLKNQPGIKKLSIDVMKSLGLYTDKDGYNKAAEILADNNECPGMNLVKFGEDINTIRKRMTIEHRSILSEIEEAVKVYEDYYVFETISGTIREQTESVPREAFREALANAVMHRAWDIPAAISVFMYSDRIEITSPGGLVPGLSPEEYLRGGISIPRNRLIADVMLRIGMIEKIGTGILRIKSAYQNNLVKPLFEIFENSIKVTLPIVDVNGLSEDEQIIYKVISRTNPLSTGEITEKVPFSKSKVLTLLKKMRDKNIVYSEGSGRGTKYYR
ncbi:MAG: ATP-binding protein [Eubacterium sp.]|nr:ATP-binding protein [Eubacterium sp.]